MVISDRQIMQLMDIANLCAKIVSEEDNERQIRKLLNAIINQQPDKLIEVKDE